MILVSAKNKLATQFYFSLGKDQSIGEISSFVSIQVDGDLGTDEIEILLVGIDVDDASTGKEGSSNQAMLDDTGTAVKITASTANPLGFYRPGRYLIKKPVTTNNVGIMLFTDARN